MSFTRDFGAFNEIVDDVRDYIINMLDSYDQSNLSITSKSFNVLDQQKRRKISNTQFVRAGFFATSSAFSFLTTKQLDAFTHFLNPYSSTRLQDEFNTWLISPQISLIDDLNFWEIAFNKVLLDLGLDDEFGGQRYIVTRENLAEVKEALSIIQFFREKFKEAPYQNGHNEIIGGLLKLAERKDSALIGFIKRKMFGYYLAIISVDSVIREVVMVFPEDAQLFISEFMLVAKELNMGEASMTLMYKLFLLNKRKMSIALKEMSAVRSVINLFWAKIGESDPNKYLLVGMLLPILPEFFITNDQKQLLGRLLKDLSTEIDPLNASQSLRSLKQLIDQSKEPLPPNQKFLLFIHLLNNQCDFQANEADYKSYIEWFGKCSPDLQNTINQCANYTYDLNRTEICILLFVKQLLSTSPEVRTRLLREFKRSAIHPISLLSAMPVINEDHVKSVRHICTARYYHGNENILRELLALIYDGESWLSLASNRDLINCKPGVDLNIRLIKILVTYPDSISRIAYLTNHYPEYISTIKGEIANPERTRAVKLFYGILIAPRKIFDKVFSDDQKLGVSADSINLAIESMPVCAFLIEAQDELHTYSNKRKYPLMPMYDLLEAIELLQVVPEIYKTIFTCYYYIATTNDARLVTIYCRFVDRELRANDFSFEKKLNELRKKLEDTTVKPHSVYAHISRLLDDLSANTSTNVSALARFTITAEFNPASQQDVINNDLLRKEFR